MLTAAPGGAPITCPDGGQCFKAFCSAKDGCLSTPLPFTATCTDGNVCTTEDNCNGQGLCLPGEATSCDDSNVCTTDSCHAAKGCKHEPNTAPCSDGDVCTLTDVCDGGACKGSSKFNCDDGNPCTDDSCDAAKGCVRLNNDAACDDNNSCTKDEACAGGKCAAKTPTTCDDGNSCTTESCDPGKGCQSTNNTEACTDGDVCTISDVCSDGSCKAGESQGCDDGNVCTDDKCDANKGCVSLPNQLTCTDGNKCTTDDTCADGGCTISKKFSCDDNNVCTVDTCDPKLGCEHKPRDIVCTDGDACTVGDKCVNSSCVPGPKADCDDGNVCTADSCSVTLGCQHKNVAALCTDNNVCTVSDTCSGGKCVPGAKLACSDGNPCTNDSCDKKAGCTFTANSAKCSDGNACTLNDTCAKGACKPGTARICDDKNPCTDDSCHVTKGCANTANKAVCSDNNACTENDVCAAKKCVAGTKKVCNDGNPCTDDGCSAKSGCTAVANTKPCNDGTACTQQDTCSAGACKGKKVDCSDGNPCTNDACDGAKGCVYLPNTLTCTDGNACTVDDKCALGQCVSGKKLVCNDGNPCTTDSCDKIKGCVKPPVKDGTTCGGTGQCIKGGCTCPAEQWYAPKGCLNCACNEASTYPTANVQLGSRVTMPSPTNYDQFGAFVARSGGWIAAGAPYDDDKGTDSGSVTMYQQQADGTWQQKAKLFGGNTGTKDLFGNSVAMSGGTLVVGSNGEDDNGSGSGAVYVFGLRKDGKWAQTAKLLASDGKTGDQLGLSVAIRGNRLVAGAPYSDRVASNAGAAYVYERQPKGGWKQVAVLSHAAAKADDNCGIAVATAGVHVAAGCRNDDDKAGNAGSVLMFRRNPDGTWQSEGLLYASDAAAGDGFGSALAMDTGWMVVGAHRENNAKGTDAGSAYVWQWQAGAWKQVAKLIAGDGNAGDQFGFAVAIDNRTLLVGAPWDDDKGGASGSVYTYNFNGTAWVYGGKVVGPGGGYELGYGVAVDSGQGAVGARGYSTFRGAWYPLTSATFNCDATGQCACTPGYGGKNCATVVNECALPAKCDDGNPCTVDSCDAKTKKCVHATAKDGATCGGTGVCSKGGCVCLEDTSMTSKGCTDCACNVTGSAATPDVVLGAAITMPSPTSFDQFGAFVSRSGGWLAVGAPYDDDKGTSSGSVTLYQRQANGSWAHKAKLFGGNTATSDLFGNSVALQAGRLIVGSNGEDDKGAESGAAYIFELQKDGTWAQKAKLVASDGKTSDHFGFAVRLDGGRAVVGAPFRDVGGNAAGAGYVFERQGDGSWKQTAVLRPKANAAGDECGISVALHGDHLAMGCRYDDDKGSKSGSVATFRRYADGTWYQTGLLVASDGAANDFLGYSVAMHGDWLVAGAYRDDAKHVDQGAAYVFRRNLAGAWSQFAKLSAIDAGGSDQYGFAVAIHNGAIVVGAPWDDDKGSASGSAYTYNWDGKAWAYGGKVTGASGGYELGYAVDVENGDGVVGARGVSTFRGAVFPLNTASYKCNMITECTCKPGYGGPKCATLVDPCQVPTACDDGDVCTTDSCDAKTKKCVHTAASNGSKCGATNVCSIGKCVPPSQALSKLYIMALNNGHNGALGGIKGADALCQQEGIAAGYKQKWKAFLSTSSSNVKDLLKGDQASKLPIYNQKNQKLFENWNDIFDGNSQADTFYYSFSGRKVDENTGANPEWNDADAWTGTLTNGTKSSNHCSNWTSVSGNGTATELDVGGYQLLKQETRPCSTYLAVLCVSVQDGYTEDATYGTASKPGQSCLDILQVRPSLKNKSGNFVITTPKVKSLTVYCDMSADGGGYTYYPVSNGKRTYRYTDNDSCKDLGLQMVMPRSKAHWSSMLGKYGTSYFKTIPGVYKTSNGGNYTGCKMRNPTYYGDGCGAWRVGDGGRWWMRDSNYSEPNGDYTANCWLSMYNWNVNDIRYNDQNCSYSTTKYICSTNNKG